MTKYISGKQARTPNNIRDFEFFKDYVKKCLQPFDELGNIIPPPDVLLLQDQLKDNENRLSEIKRIMAPGRLEAERTRIERIHGDQLAPAKSSIHRTSPSPPTDEDLARKRKELEKEKETVKASIKTLTKKLASIKDFSWKDYSLPESAKGAVKILNDLDGYLYIEKEFLKIRQLIKGPPQKTVTRAPGPTKDIGGREVPYSPAEKLTPEDIKKLPKKTPELPRRINGNDLMKRWNKRDFEIIAYVKEDLLNVYYYSGGLIPKYSPYPLIIESSIFDLSEVEELERKHPELLKEKVTTRSAGQDEENKILPHETFIRNLRISYESDYKVKIQEPRKSSIVHHCSKIFQHKENKGWKDLLGILRDPNHIYYLGPAHIYSPDGSKKIKTRNKSYDRKRKRLEGINEKLINFFNKNCPVNIPEGYKLYESCQSQGKHGYGFKFQIVDFITMDGEIESKYNSYTKDQLINEIERLGKKYIEILRFKDNEVEANNFLEIFNIAVMIAKQKGWITEDRIADLLNVNKYKEIYNNIKEKPIKSINHT